MKARVINIATDRLQLRTKISSESIRWTPGDRDDLSRHIRANGSVGLRCGGPKGSLKLKIEPQIGRVHSASADINRHMW